MHHSNNDTAAKALMGAVAGGVATWIMDRVDWFMFDHEDPEARRRTERVRPGGMDPAHVVANQIAEATGNELSPKQPHPAGVAMHYGLGIGPAALYGAFRDQYPAISTGRGSLFGLAVFLLHDEGVNTLTGSGADPRDYPWQAHARGLVAHLVYGMATDAALNILEKASQRRGESSYR
jgi:hypothetical protein